MPTDAETIELLTLLVAAYPGAKNVTEDTVIAYTALLRDLDRDALAWAIDRITKTQKWFPSVAEIRDVIAQAITNVGTAEEAWLDVRGQIQYAGVYRIPTFKSPVTKRAVEAIGWRTLCMSESDEMPAHRAHFYRTWDALAKRVVDEVNMQHSQLPAPAQRPVIDATPAPRALPAAEIVQQTADALSRRRK